jgi:hypothetical protein
VIVDGAQASEDMVRSGAFGASVREVVWDAPLVAAVMVTAVLAVTDAALTENVAVVLPPMMVTDAGSANCEAVRDSVMVVPPAGAGADNATVQVAVPGVMIVDGLHPSESIVTGTTAGASVSGVFLEVPLYEAVTVALMEMATRSAVAAKAAKELPAGISIAFGTVSCGMDDDSVILAPSAGAAEASATVQVVEAGVATVAGVQTRADIAPEETGGARVSTYDCELVPFVAVTAIVVLADTDAAPALNEAEVLPAGMTIDGGTVS